MTNPFATLAQARQMATGSWLDLDPPDLSPRCETEPEFDRLVTGYYKFFNEGISAEVSFLARVSRSPDVDDLRRLLYNLRTAAQHADNDSALRAARSWRAQHGSSQAAADGLADALCRALQTLSGIALSVARDRVAAAEWRDVVALDTSAVLSSVLTDLDLRFSTANQRRMLRQIEKRLEVQPGHGDRRVLVADYCVQEILSDRRPLPVPYHRVLDSLGLLGKRGAAGAVLIARSVAEIAPALGGDEFILRVAETWRAAAALRDSSGSRSTVVSDRPRA